MSATDITTTPVRPRAILAAAAIEGLLALPREERGTLRPIPMLLPEIAEAHKVLEGSKLILRSARMADGSGFAEVMHSETYGVVLSSERYADGEDRVSILTALAGVAQRVLAGELG